MVTPSSGGLGRDITPAGFWKSRGALTHPCSLPLIPAGATELVWICDDCGLRWRWALVDGVRPGVVDG